MYKSPYFKTNRLRERREKKMLKRMRTLLISPGNYSVYNKVLRFQKGVDKRIIETFKIPIYSFFRDVNFLDGSEREDNYIEIPIDFSFCNSYDSSLKVIKHFIASLIYSSGGELIVSFEKCINVDQAALFVLQIIKYDIVEQLQRLNNKLTASKSRVSVKFKESKNDVVNKMLFVNQILPEARVKVEGLMPLRGVGYIKGLKNQKHYSENKKGRIVTNVREFLNTCLVDHGYEFNPNGKNEMDGLLSEILGNGEDHSPFDTYYATANSFIEANSIAPDQIVGVINLSIMNFGYSIYEGLEKTKNENYVSYNEIDELYQTVSRLKPGGFTRENLFTLYALQEGISRLKYEDQSRGTGTMKFINSFFALGDFEDATKQYHPELSIISGRTRVICNNKYRPYQRNQVNYLSLNFENDLNKAPDPANLKSLETFFPGTILYVRVFLNKEHLTKKVYGNTKN
jgi:hypothetical protein